MLQVHSRTARPTALLLVASLLGPMLAGCSGSQRGSEANLPPVDDTRAGSVGYQEPPRQQERRGLSNTQKLVLLAGAAALYYMYKKQRDSNNRPTEQQYYLSRNGRVYYRDQNGRAHWVTPPPQGIQVPQAELDSLTRGERDIRTLRGYDGRASGEDFGGLLQGAQ